MKKPSEYFKEQYLPNTPQEEYELWSKTNNMFPYIVRAIRKAQEDAIIYTVKECVESAETTSEKYYGYKIDENSILQLSDKLIKELQMQIKSSINMIIKNKHGTFRLNSSHYNWLMRSYCFQDITTEIVQKTSFINSSWEYEKADKLKKKWDETLISS